MVNAMGPSQFLNNFGLSTINEDFEDHASRVMNTLCAPIDASDVNAKVRLPSNLWSSVINLQLSVPALSRAELHQIFGSLILWCCAPHWWDSRSTKARRDIFLFKQHIR